MIAIENEDSVNVYDNTRRKKIAINNIKLYRSSYKSTSITSGNIIIGGSVDKVALFTSEYIPNHFTDKNYITYLLYKKCNYFPKPLHFRLTIGLLQDL